MPAKQKQFVRLSKNVEPLKYKLQIQPDMEAFTFVGEENISIKLHDNVNEITLHAVDLEIYNVWFEQSKNKIEAQKISFNAKKETVTLRFASELKKGQGKLHLDFRGLIQESMRGFYRSKYSYNGREIKIATTQFESTDARRAFPCFDEPSHKAIFELSLVVPENLTTISNTLETHIGSATPESVHHSNGFKVVNFAPTPRMSTYLLAYVIGEFEYVSQKTKNGVDVRVFTPLGKKDQGRFALDVTVKVLEFLEEYFDVPYPLNTLDMISIPDFSAGAMENWGAVTFREGSLLLDEKTTAFTSKQNVAYTIAHELVHQWFGNLVTMEWWTHLWLNESFANFMGFIAIDHVFPQWKIWTLFVMDDFASALELDSLKNTHPIEVEVHHPDQISEIFDAISYQKGGSVLRMLMHYIGPENFRKGLSHYLKKHSYKNTESIHLWDAFEKASGKPVKQFMEKWVSKPGYPLINISSAGKNKISIKQQRFSIIKKPNNSKELWPIPIQLQLAKGQVSDIELLSKQSNSFKISPKHQFIKANPGETAFYRTNYDHQLLQLLDAPIKAKTLAVEDRLGIIRDVFASTKNGLYSTGEYLDLAFSYADEDSFIVWSEIVNNFSKIYRLIYDEPKLRKDLEKVYRELINHTAAKVGWNVEHKETQARSLLRAVILHNYGKYGDKKTIEQAEQIFKSRNKKPIHSDLHSTVYCLVALTNKSSIHAELIKMHNSEQSSEEQRRIMRGLMAFTDPKLFKKSLDFMLSKHVRSQDAPIGIAFGSSNNKNRKILWQWIKKNWPELHKRYKGDHLLARTIGYLSPFSDMETAKDMESFFKKNKVGSIDRTLKQVIEKISFNAQWKARTSKEVKAFLKTLQK